MNEHDYFFKNFQRQRTPETVFHHEKVTKVKPNKNMNEFFD